MIAAGDGIDAGGKNFLRGAGRDAGTAGGIFPVGDDQIEIVCAPQLRHQLLDRAPPRFAHDVADEQNFHGRSFSRSAEFCRTGNENKSGPGHIRALPPARGLQAASMSERLGRNDCPLASA